MGVFVSLISCITQWTTLVTGRYMITMMMLLYYVNLSVGQFCTDRVLVQQGGHSVLTSNKLAIFPRLNFTCNGRITRIRARVDFTNNDWTGYPYYQVWRPSSPGSMTYNKVGEVQLRDDQVISGSNGFLETNIILDSSNSIEFQSGDVVGYYHPYFCRYFTKTIYTDNGYVLYEFRGPSPTMASLNLNDAYDDLIRRQPLIQFDIVCYAPLNGQVDCGSGLVNMGLEGEDCVFSCDPGYMLQGSVTSGTCENTGSWSGGLPSCVPLNCSEDDLPIPANATVLQSPSCGPAYQSQCTVSCDEGFTGDDVTYLCNVTSDPTMVDWVAVNSIQMSQTCQKATTIDSRLCNSTKQFQVSEETICLSDDYRNSTILIVQVCEADTINELTSSLNLLTTDLVLLTNRSTNSTLACTEDLMNIFLLLEFIVNITESYPDIISSQDIVQNTVDIISNMLSPLNNPGWMELEMENPGQSQILLMTSERLALLLAENSDSGSVQVVVSDSIAISAELVDADNIKNVTFPDPNSNFTMNSSIFIPASYIQERSKTTGVDPVPVVNIIYDNIQNILPSVDIRPVSPVLSSQVTAISNTSSEFAVLLTFKYSIESDKFVPVCGFWNFSINEGRGGWDTEGVTVVSNDINSSTITCYSTHLTSFAVLVDVSGGHQDISAEENTALSVVSYIGCGISIVCLLIVIIVLIYYRNTLLKGIHHFIHLNLAIALILALIVFVSGIETATENEIGCKVVAALLQYLFTAVLSWMLCEGIMLYFLLVKVFNNGLGQRKLFYLALGWGIPVPIVAISAGVAHDQYGHDDFCWMKIENGIIWGFVAPMLAIIMINIIFLLLSLHALYKSKKHNYKETIQDASQAKIVRTILKATVILLPLLGITWVFGLLAVNREFSVFAWIFTILNSLQGMFILIFHVIRNEKEKISSCWKDKNSQQISTSSNGAKTKFKLSNQTASTDPSRFELKSES